jgi:hypothetical protein
VAAVVIAGCMVAPMDSRAEVKCPWLNAATAAGVLGGDVQMTVTVPPQADADKATDQDGYSTPEQRFNRPDALCEFSRKADSGMYTLRIDVKTMSDPAKQFASFLALCGGPAPALRGIGNEAVQCVMKNDPSMGHEQVIARVRERAFVLTISRPATPVGNGLSDDTRNIAEQVAGSIF